MTFYRYNLNKFHRNTFFLFLTRLEIEVLFSSFNRRVSPGKSGKAKVSSSESDQSSTETDSTVKSQEERTVPAGHMDPQELAQKILEETQSHMQAVESLQKANARTSRGGDARSLSTPTTPNMTPARGARGFQPSETSAFSRPPSRASLKTCPSPVSLSRHLSPLSPSTSTPPPPTRPKPPSRSSSLQKISSSYSSPVPSSPFSSLSATDQGSPLKLKHQASPHASCISPARSPTGAAPSPALSYSSAGSVSASLSPVDTPEMSRSKHDGEMQGIHRLKTFWSNAGQRHEAPSPAALLGGGNKKMSTVQRDVLGLLNLSPRHTSSRHGFQEQDTDGQQNGHQKLKTMSPSLPSPSSSRSTNSKGEVQIPAGNGYKFHSPGHFFPSSKC